MFFSPHLLDRDLGVNGLDLEALDSRCCVETFLLPSIPPRHHSFYRHLAQLDIAFFPAQLAGFDLGVYKDFCYRRQTPVVCLHMALARARFEIRVE